MSCHEQALEQETTKTQPSRTSQMLTCLLVPCVFALFIPHLSQAPLCRAVPGSALAHHRSRTPVAGRPRDRHSEGGEVGFEGCAELGAAWLSRGRALPVPTTQVTPSISH